MDRNLQLAVGRALRRDQQKGGLSRESFAELTSGHRTYMGGFEDGERDPTLKAVERTLRESILIRWISFAAENRPKGKLNPPRRHASAF
jgi:hypothetical protein